MRSKKGEPSASDVSASGHSDSGKKTKASIANGAAKAFNKLSLKTRLSTTKSPSGENPTRFQMVHTRDRSPVDSMPLPQIPTTNEEFYAAISKINAQGHLSVLNEPTERKGSSSSSRKGSQQSQSTMAPRTVTASPVSKDIVLGPTVNCSLVTNRKEVVDPPVTTPPVTASGAVRPAYARRVASEGVPPRPLSERPLIKYSSLHARPSPQVQQHTSSSTSTPSAQSAISTSSKRAPSSSSNRFGHNRVNSGETTVRRRPCRPPSLDSSESDGETLSHRVSYVRHILRDAKQKMQDSGVVVLHPAAAPVQEEDKTKCYFCQEDCLEPRDNLCGRCQSRFQPQDEVFDYSESEYEDIEFQDSPILSPAASEKPRGSTSARLSAKRRTARHPRSKGKPPRGWSEFSTTVSQQQQLQLQQLAPRSASSSPTSHVAMELKIVPPQDIKIRTVTSPTRSSAGGGGGGRSSALHHIQQALKPRAPSSSPSPGDQDPRDAVRLGKVRSGEIRRVDYPDIIKLKDPSPPKKKNPPPPKSFQDTPPLEQHHHHQSGGDSFNKSWLKYYGDGDKSSDRGSGSACAWSDRADLPASGRSSAVPATRVSTYDRVTSIYDLYASFDEA